MRICPPTSGPGTVLRRLFWGGWLSLLTCLPAPVQTCAAQTYDSPAAAQVDPDFAVQGEYSGNQRGLQVVARGDGEFEIVVYEGGLPGAGWDRTEPRRVDGDAETVAELVESMELETTTRASPTLGAVAPAGAVVLFDGTAESLQEHWQEGARRSDEGLLEQGATSRDTFRDYTLHLEFRTPFMPTASGQGRGNSGVYHQGRYETQVLDSFGLKGVNNETGGIYTVRDPDLNMCLPPLQWQTYDVQFTAARYDESGKKTSDARLTVRLNGVLVQNDVAVPRTTTAAPVAEADSPGPIYLQDHGNPVRYRNIWVLPRDAEREARRPRVPAFERFYASGSEHAADAGELLIAALACNACHADTSAIPPQRGPDLSRVAARVRADHLLAMITDPHSTKPGTTMPDPWSGVEDAEKQHQAQAIASYLSKDLRVVDRPGDSKAVQRGEQLYHTIGCTACHDAQHENAPRLASSAPLGELQTKYTLDSLTQFLLDPHAVRPGMRMPKLAADRTEARDLACYLLREVVIVPGGEKFKFTLYKGSWDKLPDFAALEPAETGNMQDLDVAGVQPKDNFALVLETYFPVTNAGEYTFHLASDDGSRLLIGDKLVVDNDGIHAPSEKSGKIQLQAGVHKLTIQYFEQGGGEELTLKVDGPDFGGADVASLVTGDPSGETLAELLPSKFRPDALLAKAGAAAFQAQGCAHCHAFQNEATTELATTELATTELATTDRTSPTMRTPLAELAAVSDRGCLAETPPAGVPNYELSPSQRAAITAALTALRPQAAAPQRTAQQRVHLTMAALNCYACHERDEVGGPETARLSWFETTTPEMGNEARLPPSLTGVGDKLKDTYVAILLENGANERPYMKTRMPGFGYEALRVLHEDLNTIDRRSEEALPASDQPLSLVISSGRKLIGDKGLACIKCHTYNDVGVEGVRAIDALKMPQRLREDWFHRYLMDPQKYRPGTRMPVSFVAGKSALPDIADGDPGLQIEAMWKYLSAENPKPPQGLIQGAIVLSPDAAPIIYRNFITDLSPRGIAVGYPEGVNLAWDAQAMSLVKIWQNEFIDASKHWVGRGPGDQSPLGDAAIKIDEDCPLASIDSIDAPWPQGSARKRGYRFLGYRLSADKQPTFRYSFENNLIEDFCRPLPGSAETRGFERTLKITSADPQPKRFFRAAVGSIQPQDGGGFRVAGGGLLTIDGAGEPHLVDVDGKQELRYALPPQTTVEITETIRW